MTSPNDRIGKAVEELLAAVAEEQSKSPGMDRVEIVHEKAVEYVRNHPSCRMIAAIRPTQIRQVANG